MVQTNMTLRETHIIGRHTREWIVTGDNCQALRQHRISFTGLSDACTPYRMVRLQPRDMHLLVCTGGEGAVLLNRKWAVCRAGNAYLSPPGAVMAFHATPRRRWQFAWVSYTFDAPAARLLRGPGCTLVETDPVPFEASLRGLHRETHTYGDETLGQTGLTCCT